ncbi:SRPBCC family protein [Rhodococcus koreensis]|uniref:SRPBCC family protein n=1 Tax=Rhodococcus koreensis TaxID=99653 RepID=UPI0036711282
MEPLVTTTRSRSVIVEAPVEVVFDFVTAVNNWTRCHPGNTGITGPGEKHVPLGVSFIEHARLGDSGPDLDLEWIVIVDETNKHWAVELGESPWDMERIEIHYEFEPHDGGTRFRRTTKFVGDANARFQTSNDLAGNAVDNADDQYLDKVAEAIASDLAKA